MLCPNCDHFCEEGARFCSECGVSLTVQPPEASFAPVPEETVIEVPPAVSEEPVIEDPPAALEDTGNADAPDPQGEADELQQIPALACSDLPQSVYAPLPPEEPQPKGALWPPLLIMAVLLGIGLLLFYLIPGNTAAPSTQSAAPWFTVEDGVLYFDESKYSGPEELTVPATVDAQTVYALSDGCFADCDQFTTVYLPDTLTIIGEGAFYDCENLRGISIPQQVTAIGEMAFFNCAELEAIHISSSVQKMGSGVFDGCGDLRYIFYSGAIDQWRSLYDEFINGQVAIYAADGTYAHIGR